jgi:hypothetical protein
MADPKMLAEVRVHLRECAKQWLVAHESVLAQNERLVVGASVYTKTSTRLRRIQAIRLTNKIRESSWKAILKRPWKKEHRSFLKALRKEGNREFSRAELRKLSEQICRDPWLAWQNLNYYFVKFHLPYRHYVCVRGYGDTYSQATFQIFRVRV